MNWTTGPLDPAVYWRRRAVVAVPVLIMLFALATCAVKAAGSGDSGKSQKTASVSKSKPSDVVSPSVTLTPSPSPTPSPSVSPSPSGSPSPSPSQSPGPVTCTDADLSVTVTLAHQKYPTNSRVPVKLSVANTSGKACNRDMGAAQQEIQLKGSTGIRLWSSDDCTSNQGVDNRTLQPNEKRTYWITWPSVTTTDVCGRPATATPGTYQLVGRIGTKWSDPVTVALT